jgi:hypothetical protein
MELKNLEANLGLSGLEGAEIPETNETDIFGELGKEKIVALKKSIKEINFPVIERESLSVKIIDECDVLKKEIEEFILINDRIQIASPDAAREKNDLRHKKIEISEMQLNEKLNCWKDIAQLKKELRIYERELSEREARIESLNKLVEDVN